jgi:hypothetical protein
VERVSRFLTTVASANLRMLVLDTGFRVETKPRRGHQGSPFGAGFLLVVKRRSSHPRDHGWWTPPPESPINHYAMLAERARRRLGEQPSMQADPPQGADGRCAECGAPRPEVAIKNADPFCSTPCARSWHDQLEDDSSSTSG